MYTLAITDFEADPDQVTDILQLAPVAVSRKGAPNATGRPGSENGWWFEAGDGRPIKGDNPNQELRRILDSFRGKKKAFTVLRRTIAPAKVRIYGGLELTSGRAYVYALEHRYLRVLADCGMTLWLDVPKSA